MFKGSGRDGCHCQTDIKAFLPAEQKESLAEAGLFTKEQEAIVKRMDEIKEIKKTYDAPQLEVDEFEKLKRKKYLEEQRAKLVESKRIEREARLKYFEKQQEHESADNGASAAAVAVSVKTAESDERRMEMRRQISMRVKHVSARRIVPHLPGPYEQLESGLELAVVET